MPGPTAGQETESAEREGTPPFPEVSIVLPAYNEGDRLSQTLAAIAETVSLPYEAIVVNDGSTDSCCQSLPTDRLTLIDLLHRQGVAHARNFGASRASAPVLVAMDAHCIPRRGWIEQLLEALDQPGVGIAAAQIRSLGCPAATAFGLTIRDRELGVDWLHQRAEDPYPVPLAGCACMAMKRGLFEAVGRFDAMRSYGMEDVELCIRVWLFGYSVMMVPGAEVGHWFKKDPFPVNWPDFLYNRLRTAVLHFDGKRLERILAALQSKPSFPSALAAVLESDIWTRRVMVRENRRYDADWFCHRFEIDL
ncbi:MAG TPA: glycosyltransferase [Verrucomicrobiae bacterium]|nr:glycosyltransferase [Verrucomicrobiae bacterium]